MKTRNHDWFDSKRLIPMYSFQVRVDGKWANVHDNGKPCIYATQSERDAARAEMRKRPQEQTK